MQAFTTETSTAIAIPGINCDTDQIIPGRFLKLDRAQGYGQFLFHDIRRTKDGRLDPAFALNRKGAETAKILILEDNFGCGSSREGAVYALVDHGIRALIAPGFGDIFYNNALKNGLLTIRLPALICKPLADYVTLHPQETITIDLERSEIKLPGGLGVHAILIEAFARDCLLLGLDEIEMSFSYLQKIENFEKKHLANNPWLER